MLGAGKSFSFPHLQLVEGKEAVILYSLTGRKSHRTQWGLLSSRHASACTRRLASLLRGILAKNVIRHPSQNISSREKEAFWTRGAKLSSRLIPDLLATTRGKS